MLFLVYEEVGTLCIKDAVLPFFFGRVYHGSWLLLALFPALPSKIKTMRVFFFWKLRKSDCDDGADLGV